MKAARQLVLGTLCLAAAVRLVLVGRRYGAATPISTRVVFVAIGLAAILAKEAAVVGSALVAIDAFARRRFSRTLLIDAALVGTTGVAFGIVRAIQARDPGMFEFTKYIFQRGLFQTYGGLAQPLPAAAADGLSFSVVAGVISTAVVAVVFVLSANRRWGRTLIASGAWIFVAVAAVFARILISADLEGSRYLYLAAPAWGIALATMACAGSPRWRRISMTALAIVIGLNVWGTRLQLQAWIRAAALRDQVLQGVAENDTARRCRSVAVSGIPERTSGAFVLLNGLPESFEMARLPPFRWDADPPCRFEWNPDSRTLTAR